MPFQKLVKALSLSVACLAPSICLATDAAYARQVMQKVEDREDGADSVSHVRIDMTDRFGETHSTQILRLRRDFGEHGLDQFTYSYISSPEEMAGTRVLTKDYRDISRLDDQWIHIPGINDLKRISVDSYTSKLMGSDITYGDLSARDLDLYEFEYIGEEKVAEWNTVVISFKPTSQEEVHRFGYTAGKVWVDLNSWLVVRSIFDLAEAGQSKLFMTHKAEKIDDIWTPTDMTFVTQKEGNVVSSTRMKMAQTRFGVGLPEALFETHSLRDFSEKDLVTLAGF